MVVSDVNEQYLGSHVRTALAGFANTFLPRFVWYEQYHNYNLIL